MLRPAEFVRIAIWILPLLTVAVWAGPAAALKDQRDTGALFSALNDLMQFAAPGRGVRWDNPETGNAGDITVIAPGSIQGRRCWDYERTYEDGGLKAILGTACEVETGLWEIVQEGQPYAKATDSSQQQAAVPEPEYDRVLVRETQSLLTKLNYDPGPVDGAFGPKTGRAVSAFQLDRGLSETGEPSEALLARLRQEVVALQAPPGSQVAPSNITPWSETPDDLPWLEETEPQAEEELPWLNQPSGDGASGSDLSVPPPPPPPPPPVE